MNNEKYEKGLKIRTQVLGEAYVKRSIENADDFTRPLQEICLLYTSPSPRDGLLSRMPSSA